MGSLFSTCMQWVFMQPCYSGARVKISLNTPVTSLLRSWCKCSVHDREVCVCVCVLHVCACLCLCACVFACLRWSQRHPSVLRGSFYQMRGIKCLKVRDLEAWGIAELWKWPRDLPGFEAGTVRLPGDCNPVGFKLHSPRMTCSSVINSPGKWEEYCALPLALITVQHLSISLDVSCWQWGCWRSSPVRSGYERSCPTLPWKSKHGTEKRPISCANH